MNLPVSLVHELNDAQVDQLVALYSKEFWCKHRTRPDVVRMLGHTDIIAVAVDDGGALVGFVRVLTDYVYKATVFDLIVRQDWRNRMIGRMLMHAIVSHPDLRNVEQIDLNCLPEMYPFYEKSGFTSELNGLGFMRRFQPGK